MSLGAHNVYHLTRPDTAAQDLASASQQTSQRSHKTIPEIFLTRLLSTKGTVQKFVDDFFGTILKVPHSFPPPVKWLFDILDDAARQTGVQNLEVRFGEEISSKFFFNFQQKTLTTKIYFSTFSTMQCIFI